MTDYTNITEELLDQYRSGLLDDDPDSKHRVELAIENNPSLTNQFGIFDQVANNLASSDPVTPEIATRLQAARSTILQRSVQRTSFNFQYAGMTIAASLALTIGLAMFVGNEQSPLSSQAELTNGFKPGSNSMMASSFNADLNENLDFYVWLDSEFSLGSQPKGI